MGRNVWVPVVSGPLAPYAAEYSSWLASREYSLSAAADRLYQFDQLSRWLAREELGAGDLSGGQAERFPRARRAAGVVSWSSPRSVALPLAFLRQVGAVPPPASVRPDGPARHQARQIPTPRHVARLPRRPLTMLSGSPAKPCDTRRISTRRRRAQHNQRLDIQPFMLS